jgi:hypothetical protein
MAYLLKVRLPIAKSYWLFSCVESHINPEEAIELALGSIPKVMDKMYDLRCKTHCRPFKNPPAYFKFFLQEAWNPKVRPAHTMAEFDIGIQNKEVTIKQHCQFF